MNVPEDLKYTKEHEWARIEGDIATIGITDYAQGELGDIVYLELPEVGSEIAKEESFGTVEAVKAVSDLYAPLSGEVVEVNETLQDVPETVNSDPYGSGWLIKIKITNPGEIDDLLDSADYKALI
jgi:glycine cleavage system H protein